MPLNELMEDCTDSCEVISIKNEHVNLVLMKLMIVEQLLKKFGYTGESNNTYIKNMLDSKWYLFDINNEQTYIILSINEYDLYEKNTSKNKLNRILQSNTSITIDKINLKSWIKKYMSMHTVDNKYNPISSVAITDKIRLPISPRCFIKLSDCSEYAKTSDSQFEDIK